MSQAIIEFTNVTKSYQLYSSPVDRVKEAFHPFKKVYHQHFNALTDVSFDIKRGETVGIVGRNGSGKSTLLQLACSILQPTSGSVNVEGRISALLELGAGFNPEFTGRDNVYLNAAILGLKREEVDSCFGDIEDFASIGEFIDQPVKMYSSGMYVRLAFAVAINVQPEILIVDEALAVGDAVFQAKCFAKFREFQDRGITIVFVTHAVDLITKYCSRGLLLDQGTLLQSGSPKDIVDEYNRRLTRTSVSRARSQAAARPVGPESAVLQPQAKWEGIFAVNPQENRYGNGLATILEAGFFNADGDPVQTLVKGDVCEIRLRVVFNGTVNDPVLAFTVKDTKGFDITGTNTWYRNVSTGSYEAGETVEIVFTQTVTLNSGNFVISFGCSGFEDGEYVVYDRRYDYMGFEVVANTAGVGFFDMEPEITLYR